MANEIEAIATNNYILATQQAVTHDNSLSGNGTVDSPLGVSETVLWEGTLGSTGIDINLNESVRNFKGLKIYVQCKTNSLGRAIQVSEFASTWAVQSPIGLYYVNATDRGGGHTTTNMIYVQVYSDTVVSLLSGSKWYDGTFTNNVSTYDFNVVKIVGINRIANN